MSLVKTGGATAVWSRTVFRLQPALPIVLATVMLFAISPIVAPGSLTASSLASMLPFAAILAVAAIGQTLVVQQGGLDFSVAGTITLSVVVLTKFAGQQPGFRLASAAVITIVVSATIGFINGLLITKRGMAPLITTLAVNALLLGVVQDITGGLSVVPVPEVLTHYALGSTLGLYNTVLLAAGVLLVYTIVIKTTVFGRRFEAVGAGAAASRIAGIAVDRYRVFAYVAASITYAVAGIMLAAYLRTPGLDVGESYLLASIAAVVVGGTALTGGTGSALATAIAALFLTQLNALLLATGAPTAVNYLLQGLAIGASIGVRVFVAGRNGSRRFGGTPKWRCIEAPTRVAAGGLAGRKDLP